MSYKILKKTTALLKCLIFIMSSFEKELNIAYFA